jgi:hypothetical protein
MMGIQKNEKIKPKGWIWDKLTGFKINEVQKLR